MGSAMGSAYMYCSPTPQYVIRLHALLQAAHIVPLPTTLHNYVLYQALHIVPLPTTLHDYVLYQAADIVPQHCTPMCCIRQCIQSHSPLCCTTIAHIVPLHTTLQDYVLYQAVHIVTLPTMLHDYVLYQAAHIVPLPTMLHDYVLYQATHIVQLPATLYDYVLYQATHSPTPTTHQSDSVLLYNVYVLSSVCYRQRKFIDQKLPQQIKFRMFVFADLSLKRKSDEKYSVKLHNPTHLPV